LQVVGLGFDYNSYRITQNGPGGKFGGWQRLVIPASSGIDISTHPMISLTAEAAAEATLSIRVGVEPTPASPPISASSKTSADLMTECVAELAAAGLACAEAALAVVAKNTKKAFAAGAVCATATNSASVKCYEAAVSLSPSGDSESPDKGGIRQVNPPRTFDVLPGTGAGINVA
jgi:hypothetical protein